MCIGTYETIAVDKRISLEDRLKQIVPMFFDYDASNPYWKIGEHIKKSEFFKNIPDLKMSEFWSFLTNIEKVTNQKTQFEHKKEINEMLNKPVAKFLQQKYKINKVKDVVFLENTESFELGQKEVAHFGRLPTSELQRILGNSSLLTPNPKFFNIIK